MDPRDACILLRSGAVLSQTERSGMAAMIEDLGREAKYAKRLEEDAYRNGKCWDCGRYNCSGHY